MPFKFDQLSDRMRQKIETAGPDAGAYWDKAIDLFLEDPHGQVIVQALSCIVRARSHNPGVVRIGYPEMRLVGFADNGSLANIRAELRIVGGNMYASRDLNPAKPADVGSEVVSYFGRYFGLFGAGVEFDEGTA